MVGPSYAQHEHWLRYQEFFPGALRVTAENAPAEQWWPWRDVQVHVDRVARPLVHDEPTPAPADCWDRRRDACDPLTGIVTG